MHTSGKIPRFRPKEEQMVDSTIPERRLGMSGDLTDRGGLVAALGPRGPDFDPHPTSVQAQPSSAQEAHRTFARFLCPDP